MTTRCVICGEHVNDNDAAEMYDPDAATELVEMEYRVLTMDFAERWSDKRQQVEVANFQQRLNELGAEGWEMISYESVPMYGAFSNKLKGHAYLLFVKRQVG